MCALFLSVFVLLAACTPVDNSNSDETIDDGKTDNGKTASGFFNVANVTPKDLLEPTLEEPNSPPRIVARGANDFAFRLSAQLV